MHFMKYFVYAFYMGYYNSYNAKGLELNWICLSTLKFLYIKRITKIIIRPVSAICTNFNFTPYNNNSMIKVLYGFSCNYDSIGNSNINCKRCASYVEFFFYIFLLFSPFFSLLFQPFENVQPYKMTHYCHSVQYNRINIYICIKKTYCILKYLKQSILFI